MGAYQINDLERLTGIKAHTIRIWEKRYGLITPYRTDTNRRTYDDEQVRRLLNVTTLLSYGHKISRIAALNDEEIYRQIEGGATDRSHVHVHTAYVNDLVTTMLAYDEDGFERIFSAAVLRAGLYDAMLKIIYPFLVKVGVLWSVNKTAPVQEHFASCIVRRKLMAAVDGALPPTKKDRRFLLFLPPGEWHEIGLLFANYILRSHGFETVYLGQSVALHDMDKVMSAVRPYAVFTLFIASKPHREMNELLAAYAKDKDVRIYFSGNATLLNSIKDTPSNAYRLNEVSEMADALLSL